MASILSSAGRRRHSLYSLRSLFSPSPSPSTSTSTSNTAVEKSSPLSAVSDSLFCRESDPSRSISTLFSFPDRSCARYAADLSLRRISQSLNYTTRSCLLHSFLSRASSEQEFASLLISYGSAFLPHEALYAFLSRVATSHPFSVSTLSFNALLSAFLRSRCHREVPDLFFSITSEHSISPDVVSYGLLVQALFRSNRSADAFATLKQIRDEQEIVLTDQIYGLLLVSLRRHQKAEEANQIWNEMVSNGVRLNRTAYNVKVWYHAIRGETEKVLQLISEMEASGVNKVRPDKITYNYLIGCLSKDSTVEDVKEAYKTIISMKNRFPPNVATLNKIFLCSLRYGDFETGMEVFRDSLKSNKLPCFMVLKKLVEGLVKEGRVEAAKEVIKEARNKSRISSTDRWKAVEKELGLDSDCGVADLSQKTV